MARWSLLISLYVLLSVSVVSAHAAIPEPSNSAAIIEANRLLEEEVKLAARPQVYMVLDLTAQVLVIKSRGLELNRLPIAAWRRVGDGPLSGVFRLRTRPSVSRPKAAPADEASVTAIELQHMPDRYTLMFDPGLVIRVGRSAREQPWPWIKERALEWWSYLSDVIGIRASHNEAPAVRLYLTVTQETAQSLAWTMTDGMPLIVGRTALP